MGSRACDNRRGVAVTVGHGGAGPFASPIAPSIAALLFERSRVLPSAFTTADFRRRAVDEQHGGPAIIAIKTSSPCPRALRLCWDRRLLCGGARALG